MSVDLTPEPDLDHLAAIAVGIAEKIRTDNLTVMRDQLIQLCRQHPVKASQVIMVFAAWFDLDEVTTQTLCKRAGSVAAARDQLEAVA